MAASTTAELRVLVTGAGGPAAVNFLRMVDRTGVIWFAGARATSLLRYERPKRHVLYATGRTLSPDYDGDCGLNGSTGLRKRAQASLASFRVDFSSPKSVSDSGRSGLSQRTDVFLQLLMRPGKMGLYNTGIAIGVAT